MNVLLDTHTFAYLLKDDPDLSRIARAAIEDATLIWLTTATLYEIGQKVRFGKWPAMEAVAPDLIDAIAQLGFRMIDLTPELALHAALLDWNHRDPFDRMIAASAFARDLTLITKDAAFATLPGLRTIW